MEHGVLSNSHFTDCDSKISKHVLNTRWSKHTALHIAKVELAQFGMTFDLHLVRVASLWYCPILLLRCNCKPTLLIILTLSDYSSHKLMVGFMNEAIYSPNDNSLVWHFHIYNGGQSLDNNYLLCFWKKHFMLIKAEFVWLKIQ